MKNLITHFGSSRTIPRVTTLALAMVIAAAGQSVNADRIVSGTSLSYAPNAETQPYEATGFGGWNLDNIEVWMSGDGGDYDELTGYYYFGEGTDYTYQANVIEDGEHLGIVLAKDWPVGEPAGIKIVNDDLAVKEPKPTNCIMSTSYLDEHFLDSTDPQQVLCSGPFQSHKRYKLAMLPPAVVEGSGFEKGIDLVFNVEDEEGSRDYQVFQKINNWTDGRLDGFTIQVGTGTGSAFVPASGEGGAGVVNLSLSVPSDIWDANQLAVFSIGLFGPPDNKHDRLDGGFFDKSSRAGFYIQEYGYAGENSGETDILTSGDPLPSAYAEVPPGGAADGQFGAWLSNNMLPEGIFWDDDGNPETDAELIAWFGYNPNSDTYGWMKGVADDFALVDLEQEFAVWSENLEYTQGEIDDLVNVGLSYVVTVGDLGDANNFTIRITPSVDDSGQDMPGYVDEEVAPSLEFSSSDGVVAISPYGTFEVGSLLTARVGDADLNTDPGVAETVDVTIATVGMSETLTLIEQGENRGVFAATLPEAYGEVPAGTVVTVTYNDLDIGDIAETSLVKTASTTASDGEEPPPPVNVVSIADFSVPESLFVGQSGKVSVTVANARESEEAVSGEVIVVANGVEIMREPFTDLGPNTKDKFPIRWTAEAEGDVYWTAVVIIDEQNVDNATATTSVTIKPGNNKNFGGN